MSLAIILSAAAAAQASSPSAGDAKPFNCIDKTTFAVNSECMSQEIESNLVFKQAEVAIVENAALVSDRAMATLTFNEETMTINVIAHKDATIARVDETLVNSNQDNIVKK